MLRLSHISKTFNTIRVLDDINLEFFAGEAHAICGENGAGKTTLMNIMAGNLAPDEGGLYWEGNKVNDLTISRAHAMGIGIVYQERSLADNLSIAENIYVGRVPSSNGFIDYKRLFAAAGKLLVELNLGHISPSEMVGNLSAAQKQLVEIAKALSLKPRLLILDEPTASITATETEILFDIIRKLKNEQVAVVYISHRLAEITAIADKISVLKDGKYQGTLEGAAATSADIIKLMVGREIAVQRGASFATSDLLLDVQHLSGKGFSEVSIQVNRGEILGIGGLVGAGRTELAKAIFGAAEIYSGQMSLAGEEIKPKAPHEAVRLGIAYVPEERKRLGIFDEMSVSENIIAGSLRKGFLRKRENDRIAGDFIKSLRIRVGAPRQPLRNLSGGNQQKVVLARWLHTDPRLLIVDEPTHGVDVGAKAEVHELLRQLAKKGVGIILISSELPELLMLSDRIAVMHEGRLKGVLSRENASEEAVMQLASGYPN